MERRKPKLSCQETALRYLARRDYSRKELETRLKSKGFTQTEIFATLNRLEAEGLINDYEFALSYAEVLITQRLMSDFAAVERIVRRGVERSVAAKAVAELAADTPERLRAWQLLQKWRRGELSELDRKSFVVAARQRLARRGFGFDTIADVLERFAKEECYNG